MVGRGARANNSGSDGLSTPAKPAAVSGPGELSQRTDGAFGKNPSNATQAAQHIPTKTYGDSKQLTEQQMGAPMASAAATPVTGGSPSPSTPGAGGQGGGM